MKLLRLTAYVAGAAMLSLSTASEKLKYQLKYPDTPHYQINYLPHPLAIKVSKRSALPDAQAPPYKQPNAYLCDGTGFKGNCLLVPGSDGVCWSLLHDPSWNRKIAAFGPDQGLTCTIFASGQCGLDEDPDNEQLTMEYPGIADLGEVGFAWKVQSWTCSTL